MSTEQPFDNKPLQEIKLFQCGVCAEFSLGVVKPNGCPICKQGNPFMEIKGVIKLDTT